MKFCYRNPAAVWVVGRVAFSLSFRVMRWLVSDVCRGNHVPEAKELARSNGIDSFKVSARQRYGTRVKGNAWWIVEIHYILHNVSSR